MRCRGSLVCTVVCTAVLSLGTSACMPDVANDPIPDFMAFDSASGRVPTPNIIGVNPDTDRIDLSLLGIDVPPDCLDQTTLPVAQCEFYQYLERLDGFPTMSGLSTAASRALDPASLTCAGGEADNLVVINTGLQRKVTGLQVLVEDDGWVAVSSPAGWEVDSLYVVAVRGYDHGVVTDEDGNRVVASVTYNLLKRAESLLTCAPDPHDPGELDDPVVDPHCKYHVLLMDMYKSEYDDDPVALERAVFDMLVSLETLRQGFLGESEPDNIWRIVELTGFMSKDEIAITWAFPTHRASVAELNPDSGLVPQVTGDHTVRIPVKGSLNPATLIPSSGFEPPYLAGATTIVMDITALQSCGSPTECLEGFPSFDVVHRDGDLELSFDASPLQDNHQYAMVLVASDDPGRPGIENADGLPMVASPVTVALRARGPVLIDGHSVISSFDDAQAASLEDARLQLIDLLDPAGFLMGAGVLTRENIAYVYVVDHGSP